MFSPRPHIECFCRPTGYSYPLQRCPLSSFPTVRIIPPCPSRVKDVLQDSPHDAPILRSNFTLGVPSFFAEDIRQARSAQSESRRNSSSVAEAQKMTLPVPWVSNIV